MNKFKRIKNLIDNALFEAGVTLEMDDYCEGELNGKPFRLSGYDQMDFVIDDDFDRFASSEYVSFDVNSKKGLRQMVRFIKEGQEALA